MMHAAMLALRRTRDRQLSAMGFDSALRSGVLGSYLEMMDRGSSGGYGVRRAVACKMQPGADPWRTSWYLDRGGE